MKIGIVGFPGSGKTTLFNALTGLNVPTGFGGKVNMGVIKVPDPRVDRLAEIDDPRKITYAEIAFADVPGGRGTGSLDPQTLGRIKEMDTLALVVRGFDDGSGEERPASELSSFETEIIISDMQIVEKRIERLAKDHSDARQLDLLRRCLAHLESEKALRSLEVSLEDRRSLAGFAFLSIKPMIVVLSLSEEGARASAPADLTELAEARGLALIPICGSVEAEIAALEPADQAEFLADLGLEEPASARFVRAAYRTLDLITFLTHGKDECRAWSIPKGSTAVDAAGAIHSDLARGFIRAEVIAFDDFDALGSEAACRDAGKLRIEGKDYLVKDGDIVHVRFNV